MKNQRHQKLAREIVRLIQRDDLPAGHHLTALALARALGISRSPVQPALQHLCRLGVAKHDENRGFFLAIPASRLGPVTDKLAAEAEDPVYEATARDRLNRELPDTVTEAELMRRYRAPRGAVRKALARIVEEGWVERRAGYGWTFLPMIDSVKAYEESYAFRQMIEPAGLLSPHFVADRGALDACRRTQERIRDGGYRTMTAVELFEANAHFHEALAACTGNRFILQSLRRINRLRRLVEYRQAVERAPRLTYCLEHLDILDCIDHGEHLRAAELMRQHLEIGRRDKSRMKALPRGFLQSGAPRKRSRSA